MSSYIRTWLYILQYSTVYVRMYTYVLYMYTTALLFRFYIRILCTYIRTYVHLFMQMRTHALAGLHVCCCAGIVLVSDAISAMGLSDGIHRLSDLQVDVCDGKAQLEGTDTLAGR